MSESLSQAEVPSRYRVHLLSDPKPTDRGILYRRGEQRFLLAWERVKRALAAEVGESEGARAIVFDLAVEVAGPECVVCRVDAAPGDAAQTLARAIQLGLGPGRCDESLRATVSDGWPSRSHPDLETFEDAALESIRFRPLG
jgi:hypothetical protein